MEELVGQLEALLQEKGQLPYDLVELPKLIAERFGCPQPRGCQVHEALRLLHHRGKLRCRIEAGGKPVLVPADPQTLDSGEEP